MSIKYTAFPFNFYINSYFQEDQLDWAFYILKLTVIRCNSICRYKSHLSMNVCLMLRLPFHF